MLPCEDLGTSYNRDSEHNMGMYFDNYENTGISEVSNEPDLDSITNHYFNKRVPNTI